MLQDGGLCFRNEANNTVLKNVLVRRCSTGILSTDRHSGNFSLYNVEVTESGGKGRSWGHAVYVASDQHAFPGSRFILKNSFLHHNKGNNLVTCLNLLATIRNTISQVSSLWFATIQC